MFRAIVSSVIFLGLTTIAHAQAPEFERIFGPEVPTGPYKHPACMTELANGDLYLVYYGGEGEYANATAVFGSRRKQGEKKWSDPVKVANDPFRSVGNGVIWQSPDGLVWLFYVVRYGETWSTSRIQFKVSTDNAYTWSDASPLALEEGMMVRNRPIVLADGSYLLPAYKETGHDTEKVGADSTSLFFRFDPKAKAKSWVETGRIRSANGNIQPAPVEIGPGRIVAYCRRGGGYDPKEIGYIVRSESTDNGKTWSEGKNSSFPNPNAAVDFLKLQNGHLILVYNDSMTSRTPLTVALSTDNDATWPVKRDLVSGPGDFGYPLAFQSRDGKIHVVYTSEKRKVINHATFDESWISGAR